PDRQLDTLEVLSALSGKRKPAGRGREGTLVVTEPRGESEGHPRGTGDATATADRGGLAPRPTLSPAHPGAWHRQGARGERPPAGRGPGAPRRLGPAPNATPALPPPVSPLSGGARSSQCSDCRVRDGRCGRPRCFGMKLYEYRKARPRERLGHQRSVVGG